MAKKKSKSVTITEGVCKDALCIIDRGLSNGLAESGQVCIEYAVSIATGTPEDKDGPKCVNKNLRSLKIDLNDDLPWDSPEHRAQGLRRIGIAQLGTGKGSGFKWGQFAAAVKKYNKQFLADFVVAANIPTVELSPADRALVKEALISRDSGVVSDAIATLQEFEERLDNNVEINADPNNVTQFIFALTGQRHNQQPDFEAYIEGLVQILKRLKTKGSKFLYLTEGKKKFKLREELKDILNNIGDE